jgi:hypothetical protein
VKHNVKAWVYEDVLGQVVGKEGNGEILEEKTIIFSDESLHDLIFKQGIH